MKNIIKIFLCAILLCAAFAQAKAEVAILQVTDEESYKNKEDFSNTYEINVNEGGTYEIVKCQAVRLKKNWFVTAAHCLEKQCKEICHLQARLVVGPNYEVDLITTHDQKNAKKIFITPKNEKNLPVATDMALIFFKPSDSKLDFKDPSARLTLSNPSITESVFLARSKDAAQYYKAANGTNIPPLLVLPDKERKAFKRAFSIISIWSGQREVLKSKDTVFFTPNGGFLYTVNFGVIKGISGSGVMTNTGELAGITSAKAEFSAFSGGKIIKQTPMLYIAPFTETSLEFIKKYISNLDYITADDSYLRDLTKEETAEAKIVEKETYKLLSQMSSK